MAQIKCRLEEAHHISCRPQPPSALHSTCAASPHVCMRSFCTAWSFGVRLVEVLRCSPAQSMRSIIARGTTTADDTYSAIAYLTSALHSCPLQSTPLYQAPADAGEQLAVEHCSSSGRKAYRLCYYWATYNSVPQPSNAMPCHAIPYHVMSDDPFPSQTVGTK